MSCPHLGCRQSFHPNFSATAKSAQKAWSHQRELQPCDVQISRCANGSYKCPKPFRCNLQQAACGRSGCDYAGEGPAWHPTSRTVTRLFRLAERRGYRYAVPGANAAISSMWARCYYQHGSTWAPILPGTDALAAHGRLHKFRSGRDAASGAVSSQVAKA